MSRKTSAYAKNLARRAPMAAPPICITIMENKIQEEMKKMQAMRESADAKFNSQMITTKIKLYEMDDGQDATEMLALLAVVIGSPAQAGAAMGWHDTQPWVRQLHGALRCIQDMCLTGYKWSAMYAPALHRACDLAAEDRPGIPVDVFVQAYADATLFSNMIEAHTIDRESVFDVSRHKQLEAA